MLPFGTFVGVPGDTPATPIVGNGASGTTIHPPLVELGQCGAVVDNVAA